MSNSIKAAHPAGGAFTQKLAGPVTDYLGRAAVAALFLDAARYHLTEGWGQTLADMSARGVPLPVPALLLAMAASILLSLALLFDIRARWAALGLALYAISVSLVMYTPFIGLGRLALIFFVKDLAIFGALLSLSRNLPDNGWRPIFWRVA